MLSRYLNYPSHSVFNRIFVISDQSNNFGYGLRIAAKYLGSNAIYCSPTGLPGSGAGRGGGGGGSVREAGGGLGEFGAAREEQFFFNKQREQLEKIKKKLKDLKDSKSGDLKRKEEK